MVEILYEQMNTLALVFAIENTVFAAVEETVSANAGHFAELETAEGAVAMMVAKQEMLHLY